MGEPAWPVEVEVRKRARAVAIIARPWMVVTALAAVALVEAAGKRWW